MSACRLAFDCCRNFVRYIWDLFRKKLFVRECGSRLPPPIFPIAQAHAPRTISSLSLMPFSSEARAAGSCWLPSTIAAFRRIPLRLARHKGVFRKRSRKTVVVHFEQGVQVKRGRSRERCAFPGLMSRALCCSTDILLGKRHNQKASCQLHHETQAEWHREVLWSNS